MTLTRLRNPLLAFLTVAFVIACGHPNKEAALKQGVADAKAAFAEAKTHPNQQAELEALAATNMGPALFVTRHLPPGAPFTNFQALAGPWTIVVRATGNGEYTLEAYGEDGARPLSTDKVSIN